MSYSIVNYSDTTLKLTEGTKELIYKKAYCSTKVDGDYLIFSTHQLETGLGKQQYAILYSDCSSPSAGSASKLKDAVDAIIDSYAGGGTGGGETINVIMAHISAY